MLFDLAIGCDLPDSPPVFARSPTRASGPVPTSTTKVEMPLVLALVTYTGRSWIGVLATKKHTPARTPILLTHSSAKVTRIGTSAGVRFLELKRNAASCIDSQSHRPSFPGLNKLERKTSVQNGSTSTLNTVLSPLKCLRHQTAYLRPYSALKPAEAAKWTMLLLAQKGLMGRPYSCCPTNCLHS
jgi:hypothetical protein